MFLIRANHMCTLKGFPRVRGDVPVTNTFNELAGPFSPRARGCSPKQKPLAGTLVVFPACAGMFLPVSWANWTAWGFPRVRGDVPLPQVQQLRLIVFSPRARGCSLAKLIIDRIRTVFPACAGMFRGLALV